MGQKTVWWHWCHFGPCGRLRRWSYQRESTCHAYSIWTSMRYMIWRLWWRSFSSNTTTCSNARLLSFIKNIPNYLEFFNAYSFLIPWAGMVQCSLLTTNGFILVLATNIRINKFRYLYQDCQCFFCTLPVKNSGNCMRSTIHHYCEVPPIRNSWLVHLDERITNLLASFIHLKLGFNNVWSYCMFPFTHIKIGYEMLCEPQRDLTPEIAAQKLRAVS